jgi:hypothetical protein
LKFLNLITDLNLNESLHSSLYWKRSTFMQCSGAGTTGRCRSRSTLKAMAPNAAPAIAGMFTMNGFGKIAFPVPVHKTCNLPGHTGIYRFWTN